MCIQARDSRQGSPVVARKPDSSLMGLLVHHLPRFGSYVSCTTPTDLSPSHSHSLPPSSARVLLFWNLTNPARRGVLLNPLPKTLRCRSSVPGLLVPYRSPSHCSPSWTHPFSSALVHTLASPPSYLPLEWHHEGAILSLHSCEMQTNPHSDSS